MGDKLLVFIGTYGVIMFNILVVLFSYVLFHDDVSNAIAIGFTILFGGTALFFDWKLAKYFLGVLKIMRQNKKKNGKV